MARIFPLRPPRPVKPQTAEQVRNKPEPVEPAKKKPDITDLAPHFDVPAFNKAEAAMREDDYQCFMLLRELWHRGQLDLLEATLIKNEGWDGEEIARINEQFQTIKERLTMREQHCEEMLQAVVGRK